jgi:hypothetical protein
LRVPTDGPRLSSGLASAMTAAAASRSHSTCTNRAQSLQAMAASSLTLIASPQHRQGYPPHPPTHTHARAHAHDSLRGKRGNPGPWSGPREVSAPSPHLYGCSAPVAEGAMGLPMASLCGASAASTTVVAAGAAGPQQSHSMKRGPASSAPGGSEAGWGGTKKLTLGISKWRFPAR